MEIITVSRLITLIILITINARTNAEEELYNNNGWTPISREKILENLHRHFVKIPNKEYSTAFWDPVVLNEESNVYYEQNTDLSPRDINRELMNNNFDIVLDDIQNQMDETDQKQNTKEEYFEGRGIQRSSGVLPRKAKKMADNENKIDLSHEGKTDEVRKYIKLNDVGKKIERTNEKVNNYEVIEATETTEVKDLIDLNQSEKELNKVYFKPKLETTMSKNLSNTLFSILGNYNIRINDDLTNYALSRSNHKTNSPKEGYVYPAPYTPIRNSENHLPVDPLLAVLLSNYGYYLPGFYGFPGNYNNIYGYLASNNIHNNKPFGAYKIYSDTDSSQ